MTGSYEEARKKATARQNQGAVVVFELFLGGFGLGAVGALQPKIETTNAKVTSEIMALRYMSDIPLWLGETGF